MFTSNKYKSLIYVLAVLSAIVSVFYLRSFLENEYAFNGKDLHKRGEFTIEGDGIRTHNTQNGIFTYGPYAKLDKGSYKIVLDYQLSKDGKASFDVVTDIGKNCLYKTTLSADKNRAYAVVKLDKFSELEVRTFYQGGDFFVVKGLKIVPMSLWKHYDVLLGITLFTLFFWFYFKLFAWLVKLKWVQNNSRIEIVFLAVFFGLLFIPMSNISDADKSIQENRMLAKFPSLYVNGKLNKTYGTDFEKWFNDHFLGRNLILNFYTDMKRNINVLIQQGRVYTGKDGWYFFTDDFDNKSLDKVKLLEVIKNIDRFQSFCQDNGIKCYIEIVPRRAEFAKDKGMRKFGKGNVDFAGVLSQVVKKKLGYGIIYPFEEMKAADKQDFVCFKTDHHWTEWGAYIGYQALMGRIKEDFPELIPVTENDFDVFYDNKVRAEFERRFWQGSLCNSLSFSISDCPLNVKYRYYMNKDAKNLEVRQDDNKNKFFKYPAKNNLKAVVIGNSFAENLSSFMAYTFSEYIKLRSNNSNVDNLKLSRWEDLILKEKPDILVLLFESRYIDMLNTMF